MARVICLLTAVIGLASLVGCGGSAASSAPTYGGEDGMILARMVENLGDESQPQAYFMSTIKLSPTERKQFRGCSFEVIGEPVVAGDSATANVKVIAGKAEPVEVQWAFAKEKDKWKIQSAPLK